MRENQREAIKALLQREDKKIAGWVVRFSLADHAERSSNGTWIEKAQGLETAERLAGRNGFIETVYELIDQRPLLLSL